MTREEAIKVLKAYAPCAHVWVGCAPTHWLKCQGCGREIHRSVLTDAGEDAARFQRALDVLTAPVVRLEWERDGDDFALLLCIDALRDRLWSGKLYSNGTGWAYNDNSGWLYNDHPLSQAEIVTAITAWHAAHLPSLHLPPFPETPDAS